MLEPTQEFQRFNVLVRNETPYNLYVFKRLTPEYAETRNEWNNIMKFKKRTKQQQKLLFSEKEEYEFILTKSFSEEFIQKVPLIIIDEGGSEEVKDESFGFGDFIHETGCETILTVKEVSNDGTNSKFAIFQKIERFCILDVGNLSSTKNIQVYINCPYSYGYEPLEESSYPIIPRAKIVMGERRHYECRFILKDDGSKITFRTVDGLDIRDITILLKGDTWIDLSSNPLTFDSLVNDESHVSILINKKRTVNGDVYFLQI